MTEIKISSLYGQFILEQRIIAATIIINQPGTGLRKYEMVNRTIYIYLKLSLSLCQFFSNVLVPFSTLAKHHLIAIISFLGLINQSTKLQGRIRCYLPKHIVLFADSWKPFGHLQVLFS